jgi:hypothetical protein
MRIVPLLVAVSVVVSACGGGDDDAVATTTTLPVSGQIDISLDPVELADEYPTEVPIPVDLLILGSEVLKGETTEIYEVTGWHAGEAIEIGRRYETVLEDLGYEVTIRNEVPDKLFFSAENATWFVSVGFFPDPVRLEGTSFGVTVVPVGAASSD